MSKSKRLGQGIEALFTANTDLEMGLDDLLQEVEEVDGYQIKQASLTELRANPYQPRKQFDHAALEELAQSIQEHGILQPLVVRKSQFGYDILAGERRFRAAKLANMTHVPVVIKQFDDTAMMELAILENIQREDLNVIEEAKGYQLLIDKLGLTQQVLSVRMGKSRAHITNTLRLLTLPDAIQEMIRQNKITMGHSKILVGLGVQESIELAEQIITQKLSVREAEELVRQLKAVEKEPKQVPKKTESAHQIELAHVKEELTQYFATKVDVTDTRIIIDYAGTDELNRLLEIIGVLDE